MCIYTSAHSGRLTVPCTKQTTATVASPSKDLGCGTVFLLNCMYRTKTVGHIIGHVKQAENT